MNARQLSYVVIIAGVLALALALRSWYHFFNFLAADMKVGLSGAWHCLYTPPSLCQFGQGVPHFSEDLYQPWPFWLGSALVIVGLVTRLALWRRD